MKRKLVADPLLAPHIYRYSLAWDEATNRPTGLEAWARMVEDALWQQLEEETAAFAREPDPTWQEQERFALEEFTERHDGCFVGREALVEEAVAFALGATGKNDAQAWCITGESGAGKSALFARVYWRLRRQVEEMPDGSGRPILLAEAGGISSRAGRLYWLLRRWTGELAAEMGVQADLPEELKVQELEERFFEMLSYAAQQRPTILMADGFNQFERSDRVLAMSGLPDPLPANVHLLATAIAGPESDKLKRRGARVSPLPAFVPGEIEAVAKAVYGRYHRDAYREVVAQLGAIADSNGKPAASNALWLTLALDLVNLLDADDFADAERDARGTVEEKLRRLVLNRCRAFPGTMEGLYAVFLGHMEKAAGRVEARSFASLLALSRSGWREEDLQTMLASAAKVLFPGEPAPTWDPLRFAIFRRFFHAHLVERGEHHQLDFTHASLREGIIDLLNGAWKPAKVDPISALHAAIADQLETALAKSPSFAAEMMWQVLGSHDLRRFAHYYARRGTGSNLLADYLVDGSPIVGNAMLSFISSALLQSHLPEVDQAVIGVKFILELHEELDFRDGWKLQGSLIEASVDCFERLVAQNPRSFNYASGLSIGYERMGERYLTLGKHGEALEFFRKDLKLVEDLHLRDPRSDEYARKLSRDCARIGDLYEHLGEYTRAEESHLRAITIAEGLRNSDPQSQDNAQALCECYSKLGQLKFNLNEYTLALELYNKGREIAEELYRRYPRSHDSAEDLSVIYIKMGVDGYLRDSGSLRRPQHLVV